MKLERELTGGDLRGPRRAADRRRRRRHDRAASIYLAVNAVAANGTSDGWAVPMTTDIPFALVVLAIISTHPPSGLRSFLITLAVVDDLLAVAVIVVFFTGSLNLLPLAGFLTAIVVFGLSTCRGITAWWLVLPPRGHRPGAARSLRVVCSAALRNLLRRSRRLPAQTLAAHVSTRPVAAAREGAQDGEPCKEPVMSAPHGEADGRPTPPGRGRVATAHADEVD